MSKSNKHIVRALKKRRQLNGLSQFKAAEIAGVSLKTYQRFERGDGDLRIGNYLSLLEGMKITELDIALDVIGIKQATAWDVAAAARVLSPEIRSALVSMIMMIYRDVGGD